MTFLALRFSGYVNGVAMRHGEVSRGMFPAYDISAITNGVHAITWTSPAFGELFDSLHSRLAHRQQLSALRHQHSDSEHSSTHTAEAKSELFEEICQSRSECSLIPSSSPSASPAAPAPTNAPIFYFRIPERLRRIAREVGPIQLVYGGKAHPHDEGGKNLIRRVVGGASALADVIKTVYVENYDMRWGQAHHLRRRSVAEHPHAPAGSLRHQRHEGRAERRPQLQRGGRLVGRRPHRRHHRMGHRQQRSRRGSVLEVAALYDKLERDIVPMFYGRPNRYSEIMRYTIALNASFFNTQRMVLQYISNAYKIQRDVAVPAMRL